MTTPKISVTIKLMVDVPTAEKMADTLPGTLFDSNGINETDLINTLAGLQAHRNSKPSDFQEISGYVQFRAEGAKVPAIRREISIKPISKKPLQNK